MNPQHAALTDALTRAANYIDALGGDSKLYRATLAAPHATTEQSEAGDHFAGVSKLVSPAAPAPCATEPDDQGGADAGSGISDEQIAALRDKHGITSSGRGIRAFDQIRNFVHAVLAMAPATTQAQEAPVSPMAKMAQALREKAAAERSDFDRRVQSGEWGPMPESGTEADALSDHVAEIEGDDAVRTLRWSSRVGAFDYPVGTKLYASPTQPQPEQIIRAAEEIHGIGAAKEKSNG